MEMIEIQSKELLYNYLFSAHEIPNCNAIGTRSTCSVLLRLDIPQEETGKDEVKVERLEIPISRKKRELIYRIYNTHHTQRKPC